MGDDIYVNIGSRSQHRSSQHETWEQQHRMLLTYIGKNGFEVETEHIGVGFRPP